MASESLREYPLEHADTVLLLLAAETKEPRQRFRCDGITRLEKLLFLLGSETDFTDEVDEFFTFEPYHYGPYSRGVYDAVDLLLGLQLLAEKRIEVGTGLDVSEELEALDDFDRNDEPQYIERQFILTESGKAVARVLSTRISPQGKASLSSIKDRYGGMPLRQLLRYVYSKYPRYAGQSRIRAGL